ncbi:lysophospholipase [Alicyclobacillus cycloheptanicus]|uniref:Lysophospholipase n=1 Tax=Alicyclobacillus cycloheptanicus TaxID=1457 RepID=A0ABT9XGY1_9BACL|nr:alpha/beta hydrolase [Alicyclobacillus cycloheptanicus]MDQ0189566.1 lysophospholipase [Alicyclobacillus cycloheptanicus]WDM01619.1 lysophospholipase [Alicyclobacillus cycloheptanicus]
MKLYESHWPVPSPRGVVVLVHGAGEHCGRYDHVAKWLNEAGYAVLGQDLPGHGKSSGRRGHVDSFELYLDAIDRMVQRVNDLYADIPKFLYGHSMGGLSVVRWLQTRPEPTKRLLQGIILTSPCLELSLPIPPLLMRVAAVIDRLWPTFTQSNRIPAEIVSRHPDVVARYGTDPLILHKVTVRWVMELQRSMMAARAGEASFPAPTLILQAGQDRLVSPAATRAFVQRLSAPRKVYHEFSEYYHELHNEPERDEVLAMITSFLDSCTQATAAEGV